MERRRRYGRTAAVLAAMLVLALLALGSCAPRPAPAALPEPCRACPRNPRADGYRAPRCWHFPTCAAADHARIPHGHFTSHFTSHRDTRSDRDTATRSRRATPDREAAPMTYTPESSFLSAPAGNPQAWADAIRPHNAGQADAIADAYFTCGAAIGINADLAIAQAVHESGWFTSAHWVKQFDPCGLGVTGPDAPGATFATIDDGVKAHYEHLVCYTMAADPPMMQQWGMLDPRHAFHDNKPRIADLERLPVRGWANPGTGYVDGIVSIANSVVGASPVSNVPTAADLGYPGTVHYATGSGESMQLSSVRWFIVHDTEGYFAGDENTLSGQISAHLLIDKSGEWRFMVPLDTVAYAAGNLPVNRQSINVENSGFADAHDGGYTDAQYRCAAAFYRWCVAQGMVNVPAVYIGKIDANGGPEPDVPGILGHQDVPRDDGAPGWGGNYGHTDPGPTYQWDKLIAYIGGSPMPQPPAPRPAVLHLNGHVVGGGFKNFWEANPLNMQAYGLPTSEEIRARIVEPDGQEHVNTVQFFERAIFVYDPAAAPSWTVTTATLGQLVEEVK